MARLLFPPATVARALTFGPSGRALAAILATSGVTHLVAPRPYEAIVPRVLPRRRQLVYLSGIAEMACAVGLWRRTRWAGPAAGALLLAVWPANVQMALDEQASSHSTLRKAAVWGRLPLQVPLLRSAWRARSGRP